MKNNFTGKKMYALLSAIILMPPMYIQIVWLKFYRSSVIADDQKEDNFLSKFPEDIQNIMPLVLISFTCCIFSLMISKNTIRQPDPGLKIAGIITALIAGLLLILDLTVILFSF